MTRRTVPRDQFLIRGGPRDPHRLAKDFLGKHEMDHKARTTLRFWRNQWWRWRDDHYGTVGDSELRAEVTASVKSQLQREESPELGTRPPPEFRVTRGLVSDVLQALSGETLLPGKVDQPSWLGDKAKARSYLALKNGLVELEALLSGKVALQSHTSEWFSPVCLPYPWDPEAECPKWLAFLDQILEADAERIALVQEWFGYSLTHDTSRQKFLMAVGDGANGKTVLLEVLTALVGEANTSHVPLELFGTRFQRTPTLGKLVNIATEVGEVNRAAEGVLKAFTSGDRMYFDRKGLEGIEARPTARLVFATNNLPQFADRSSGVWRRMIVLPFSVTIPPEKQDLHLTERLKQELPGIFNWAIEGLRRLHKNALFTLPEVCREFHDQHRLECNPAEQFLRERCVQGKGFVVPCDELFGHYSQHCEANGFRALDSRAFGKEVARAYPTVSRARKAVGSSRSYVYLGVRMGVPPLP